MKTSAVIVALGVFGAFATGCAVESPEANTRAVQQNLSCNTNSGINPMKAALAVAMAAEIGRLDAVSDLKISNNRVQLTDGAKSRCAARGNSACPNVESILSMQLTAVNDVINQGVFNAVSFREDLKASFDRQKNSEHNLSMNNPGALAGDHEMFQSSITDNGACGVHYDFDVEGSKVQNLDSRLVFFGGTENPFIDFRSTDSTVSIDPTGTMNGDTSTSSLSCTDGCYAYGLELRQTCCSCNGAQGKFRRATWDPNMLYCAL